LYRQDQEARGGAQGKAKLADVYMFDPKDLIEDSQIMAGLTPGVSRITNRDLAQFMVAVSDNAATNILYDRVGKDNVNAMLRGLGAMLAVLLVIGFAADAYAQSFFDSLPSIQGLDSAAFAGDTTIYSSDGVLLADVGNHGDHRLAVKLALAVAGSGVSTSRCRMWTVGSETK